MKILQINAWYERWSTGKLVKTLHQGYLQQGHESFVCYGRGQKSSDQNIIKTSTALEPKINSLLSRFSGMLYGGCLFSTHSIIKQIERIKPDIVHIHCANSFTANNYRLLQYLGKHSYNVVITLHAEYPYTGSCTHAFDCTKWQQGCHKCPRLKAATRSLFIDSTPKAWKKMLQAYQAIPLSNRRIVAVSKWLADRAKQSKTFEKDDIEVVFNGIDTSVYTKMMTPPSLFDDEILSKKRCLFCVPNFSIGEGDIKGCSSFLSLIEKMADIQDILFIVVGDNKSGFDFSKYHNVRYLGPIHDDHVMAEIYSNCDLTLLLSKKETYSLVTAESIACGTPVIGFKAGAPETIALPGFGTFVEQGDIDGLIKHIKAKIGTKPPLTKENTDWYSSSNMINHYLRIYDSLINKE